MPSELVFQKLLMHLEFLKQPPVGLQRSMWKRKSSQCLAISWEKNNKVGGNGEIRKAKNMCISEHTSLTLQAGKRHQQKTTRSAAPSWELWNKATFKHVSLSDESQSLHRDRIWSVDSMNPSCHLFTICRPRDHMMTYRSHKKQRCYFL